MPAYLLPDVLLNRAVVRLRAMGSAIERGKGLNDIAMLFRIPVDAIRTFVSTRRRVLPIHIQQYPVPPWLAQPST